MRPDGPVLPPHLDTELQFRLLRVYRDIVSRPYNPEGVAASLEDLLEFLSSERGRTDKNCRAVDIFFCLQEGWERGWEDDPVELAESSRTLAVRCMIRSITLTLPRTSNRRRNSCSLVYTVIVRSQPCNVVRLAV
jgi:hypothetical protein